MENPINEVAATSNQAAPVFIPSTEVDAAYLIGETKVWRQDGTKLLYPHSKGHLWEHMSRQGVILILQDLKDAEFWPKVAEFTQAKDKEGLSKLVMDSQRPSDRVEAAKKDVAEAQAKVVGTKSAPSYSMDTKRTIHHLFEIEKWNKSKIASELGVTPPTVTNAIDKIADEIKKAKENEG